MILGLGIDIVPIARIEHLLTRYPGRAERKLFSPREREDCRSRANRAEHYAARFAAKEALLKALGVPFGLHWHEIEVRTGIGGAPHLELSGEAARAATRRGVQASHLSLTHAGGMAAAVVVLEGQAGVRN